MDIILHLGAHRTGTTSFQTYLRDNAAAIAAGGTGVWGPLRTRKGLFSGLFPGPAVALRGRNLQRRAEGRVQMQVDRLAGSGVERLLISDENMIGTPRSCLREGALYPAIGERVARLSAALGGRVTRVVLSIRSQDLWWASVAAYGVPRGFPLPSPRLRDRIAAGRRGWRDVIIDLACALPDTEIAVVPFEQCSANPEMLFRTATGAPAPIDTQTRWLNRSPDLAALRQAVAERGEDPGLLPEGSGRWQPFDPAQSAALRETYEDDLFWLVAGADGLATLTEDRVRTRAGTSLPPGHMQRGHDDDNRQGHMAHSG